MQSGILKNNNFKYQLEKKSCEIIHSW